MESFKPKQERWILVCTNTPENDDPAKCGYKDSLKLAEDLKAYVKEKGLKGKVRVVKSGCLDQCGTGPIVCIQPENIWYRQVSESDLKEIKTQWIDPLATIPAKH
ncbi:MAG: (2Fe-2S) ferredoxin domain-containing protein [Candidatus Diapherotrites archaeon]|nr:(2Fe-2S) ferredoxin domain-containing protein [Candidatus Diapherotrites archaeon]